jgi:hypothetical protein
MKKAGDGWNLPGAETAVSNKYIFSSERNSGEDYYVFSKPFKFPYKVSDLIFMTTGDYCFKNAPTEISDEVLGLNIPNIKVSDCEDTEAVQVCFGSGSECDVTVTGNCVGGCDSRYETGVVDKEGVSMNFYGPLMYGAIFSDKGIYDCNVKRLMYRTGGIAEVFSEKADLMDARNCNSNLKSDLEFWETSTINASVGEVISLSQGRMKEIEKRNNAEACKVWK